MAAIVSSPMPWPRRLILLGMGILALPHAPLLFYATGSERMSHLENVLFEPTVAAPLPVLLCWLWMVWVRRERLAGFAGEERREVGALLLVFAGALTGWSHYTGVRPLLVLSLGLSSLASALMLAGPRGMRTLLYPAAFLLLAMPVPTPVVNAILHPLQLWNAAAAGGTLTLLGFDAVVSGDLVFTGDLVAQVIETCAGVRSVLTVVMATCVYTELVWHDRKRRLALIAAAPLVAILANHLRILSILFNPYGTISTVHTIQGLLTIVFSVLLIAALDALLDRVWKTEPEPHLIVEATRGQVSWEAAAGYLVICAVIAVAVLAGPRWEPGDDLEAASFADFDGRVPGYALAGFQPDFEYLGSVRFDHFVAHRSTPLGGRAGQPEVRLLIAGDRRLDPSLGLGSLKAVIPERGGFVLEGGQVPSPPAPGIEVKVVQQPRARALVYFWSRGRQGLVTETARAVLGLDRSPWRREGRSVFVRLSTVIEPGVGGLVEAASRLDDFVEALRPEFEEINVVP